MRFTAVFSETSSNFEASLHDASGAFLASFGEITQISSADLYKGAYTFTPSETETVIRTKNLTLVDNITIAPIPSNYGRIDWDGSTLTIS